jgi:energy-converting hydrogenase Eha subunit H
MKYALMILLFTGCMSVDEQNVKIVTHAKVCTDAGMDFAIGINGLTGVRDAYCIKKEPSK